MANDTAVTRWPPSIRAATEEVPLNLFNRSTVPDGTAPTYSSSDKLEKAAADIPLSFHNRILQRTLPQIQLDWPHFPNITHATGRADSVIGSFVDPFGFADDTVPGGTCNADNTRYQPMHLQYHLIGTNSGLADAGRNLANIYTSTTPPEHQLSPPEYAFPHTTP